jgi:hypothetical protein
MLLDHLIPYLPPLRRCLYEGDSSDYQDVTTEILKFWLPDSMSIPSVGELGRFLNRPLQERAKIPVDRYRFETLLPNPWQLNDRIEREDISTLFRIDDHERAEALSVAFFSGCMQSPPDDDATENAFISFWDTNIRRVMEALIPGGRSIRDSNRHTTTAAQRPDFGFLYLNVCPFRGEEKSPSNKDDPRAELGDKMTWIYDPVSYVLGKLSGLTLLRAFLAPFA